jgi:hypothetical protein
MSEEQRNQIQKMLLARFILSRLLALAANVRVMDLNFETGRAVVYFDASKADTALLAALTGGAA